MSNLVAVDRPRVILMPSTAFAISSSSSFPSGSGRCAICISGDIFHKFLRPVDLLLEFEPEPEPDAVARALRLAEREREESINTLA